MSSIGLALNQLVTRAKPFPNVIASRVLRAQSVVDGSSSAVVLFTVQVNGVYRLMAGIIARTLSSTAWLIQADFAFSAGINVAPQQSAGCQMQTGVLSQLVGWDIPLRAGDVISCGSATVSGANTGGIFDVAWTAERMQ